MRFSDFPPFILIPAYIVVVALVCLFWFVAVPVYCLAWMAVMAADRMMRIWRVFVRFDAYLSKTLDELWRGII